MKPLLQDACPSRLQRVFRWCGFWVTAIGLGPAAVWLSAILTHYHYGELAIFTLGAGLGLILGDIIREKQWVFIRGFAGGMSILLLSAAAVIGPLLGLKLWSAH